MAIKIIVLDFDGVVVESNNIKHQAFYELFSGFPDHCDEILTYHCTHNAVNRHDKFKYIMENILKQPFDQKLADKWAFDFSDLTRNRIIHCPYVIGALEFIEYFYNKFPIYIASATPLDELKIILKQRGILQYFKGIYGAPLPKMEMFKDITKKETIKPHNILYVGDSYEDYEVASDFGCVFIARTNDYDFKGLNVKMFKNMNLIHAHVLSDMIKGDENYGLPD